MNEKIIKEFQILSDYFSIKGDYRAIVYKKMINILKKLPDINNISDLKNVKGFGPRTLEKIDEIINTGTLKDTTEFKDLEKIKVLRELLSVHGIGPKNAEKLYNSGIRSVSDLNKYEQLTMTQKLGLKYYEDLNKRIPREDIDSFKKFFQNNIINKKTTKFEIVGSYRRLSKDSGDIDILISSKDVSEIPIDISYIIETLKNEDIILGTFGHTKYFFSGIISWHGIARIIDIKSYNTGQLPFALLYFTGSDTFNVRMRSEFKKLGLKLSDTKLVSLKTGENIECLKESDIFKILGQKYIKPDKRV